ncbi:MAG: sigma-54-dependent Fis family transcriptional regulator [Candidatus Eisenbacteria bacterium]|uniref:Sigma-54-dependent Fis family transcriptional regulator n=1 Tax=Eiseniibacteriota bacterium TaxID=2212470 RepID=A0A538UA94_UNCEI|nr:MAG: sigma-54-dependent Fis family transcriptional regulator [Candidatus Eisenbacteria bacterium]
MAGKATILVVERAGAATEALLALLRARGHRVAWARDAEGAFHALDEARVDAVVAPLGAARIDGLAVLRHARQRRPDACVVLSADAAGQRLAEAALAAGAHDVLPRPVARERLLAVLERGLTQQRLSARLAEMEGRLDENLSVAPFTGRSRAIARVMEQVRHLASTHVPVLIEGEAGTGKGLAALAIHQHSPRRDAPFVSLDCGALAEPLLERELFGHEADTPGGSAHAGRLELADGGTMFLEDVDELPSGAQARLLRVLQDHAFERVGGSESHRIDARLIAATRHDLEARARAGRFREDLLRRLGVARIVMPPLRDRREDRRVTRGVLDRLMSHAWPGNVRELRDTIASTVMVARSRRVIELADLGRALSPAEGEAERLAIGVGTTVEDAERQLIAATLEYAGNDKPRAAALLGIGLRTLYRKIKEYRLPH